MTASPTIPLPRRPPRADSANVAAKLPRRQASARRAKGELDMLRVAWSAAGEIARREFLSGLMARVCKKSRPGDGAKGEPHDGDPLINSFLAECVVTEVGRRVRSSALYEAYRAFCIDRREEPVSHTSLTKRLKRRGYKRHHSNVVWFVGIRLVDGSRS